VKRNRNCVHRDLRINIYQAVTPQNYKKDNYFLFINNSHILATVWRKSCGLFCCQYSVITDRNWFRMSTSVCIIWNFNLKISQFSLWNLRLLCGIIWIVLFWNVIAFSTTVCYGRFQAEAAFYDIRSYMYISVAGGSVLVKALCCKPEGRTFASQWGGFFKLT
jgi:hypothetical protein